MTGNETYTYVRGVNLIFGRARYYLYNAHGDVVQLTNTNGELTKNYSYDAFGNEREPDEDDTNPFRYCGEYYDTETGLYYLRARYYDPLIGRFTQEDTHWNTANMIYGDNPQKINERKDALGLKTYSYVPQLSAVVQSGNLYVYCVNNPVFYVDSTGDWIHLVIGAGIGFLTGAVSSVISQIAEEEPVNLWRILIGAVSGAASGFLAATGVGLVWQVVGNTALGVITNVGDQLCTNNGDISNIDHGEVLLSAFVGGIGGFVGGSGGGSKYMNSLGKRFFKRIGEALKYKAGEFLKAELLGAITYYLKSASKELISIIHSILRSYIPAITKIGVEWIDKQFEPYMG